MPPHTTGKATIREIRELEHDDSEDDASNVQEDGSAEEEEGSAPEGEETDGSEGDEGEFEDGEGDELTHAVHQLGTLFETEDGETVADVLFRAADSLDRLARLANEGLRLARAVLGVDKNGVPVRPVGVTEDIVSSVRRIAKAADAVAKATA